MKCIVGNCWPEWGKWASASKTTIEIEFMLHSRCSFMQIGHGRYVYFLFSSKTKRNKQTTTHSHLESENAIIFKSYSNLNIAFVESGFIVALEIRHHYTPFYASTSPRRFLVSAVRGRAQKLRGWQQIIETVTITRKHKRTYRYHKRRSFRVPFSNPEIKQAIDNQWLNHELCSKFFFRLGSCRGRLSAMSSPSLASSRSHWRRRWQKSTLTGIGSCLCNWTAIIVQQMQRQWDKKVWSANPILLEIQSNSTLTYPPNVTYTEFERWKLPFLLFKSDENWCQKCLNFDEIFLWSIPVTTQTVRQ